MRAVEIISPTRRTSLHRYTQALISQISLRPLDAQNKRILRWRDHFKRREIPLQAIPSPPPKLKHSKLGMGRIGKVDSSDLSCKKASASTPATGMTSVCPKASSMSDMSLQVSCEPDHLYSLGYEDATYLLGLMMRIWTSV